jgi:hypothetical protein
MAAQAKALVEARYSMALYRPRDFFEVAQKLEKECMRPSFAKKARYFKPIGAGISGPSIRFAETAARLSGNISTESLVVLETDEKRLIKVIVTDCETNAVYSQDVIIDKTVERSNPPKDAEIVRSRTNSYGKPVFIIRATEDDLQNKQNAMVSKAIRNKILRLIPADIVESCMDTCAKIIKDENAKDPESAKKSLIEAFFRIGIKVPEITEYIGHSLDTIKPEEMADLQAIGLAIKEGETTWKAVIESKNTNEKEEKSEVKKTSKNKDLKNEISAKLGMPGEDKQAAVNPANADLNEQVNTQGVPLADSARFPYE